MFFTIIINITIVIIISIQHDLHQQPRCDKKTIATMASDLMFGGGNRADLELIFAIKIYSNPQALSHHGLRPHVWRWEIGQILNLYLL